MVILYNYEQIKSATKANAEKFESDREQSQRPETNQSWLMRQSARLTEKPSPFSAVPKYYHRVSLFVNADWSRGHFMVWYKSTLHTYPESQCRQSIALEINQSTNQSTNQSIDSLNQSINQSIDRLFHRSFAQSIDQSIERPLNPSISRPDRDRSLAKVASKNAKFISERYYTGV